MAFGHEKLDVYRAAIEYVGWAYRFCEALAGHRNAKDQLLRASQAIPLNIAEVNGKETEAYRTNPIDPDTDADPGPERQP
jgi:four helix bundle protein